MNKYRPNYPALQYFTYLNSCSSGLFSQDLLDFRRTLDEEFQQKGSNFRAGVYRKVRMVKETIASVFGADPDRTALIPSCSIGINLALEALADGQKVLLLEHDYPSIVWPFESRHFDCLTVSNDSYSEEALLDLLQQHQPDIFAVSAVQYSNGEVIPPASFRKLKDAFPEVLFIVDGTQFWGTAPFSFKESGIDLFAASAFKWLCAGYGNGAMFFSEQIAAQLDSNVRGYNTFKSPMKEGRPTLGEYFEPGHQDLLTFQSLEFQVKAFAEMGLESVQEHIRQLKEIARDRITHETNYRVLTSLNPHLESGILSVNAPKEMVKHLSAEGVVCSYRRGLRFGIHFYNTEEDINKLIEAMNRFTP